MSFGERRIEGIFVTALAVTALIAGVEAQRKPLLPQIKLPHSYYYREMFVPQVTTGPASVAWSPDGAEVAIAMRGSIWRHRLGSSHTDQVVWGPG
jgi:TolB protein